MNYKSLKEKFPEFANDSISKLCTFRYVLKRGTKIYHGTYSKITDFDEERPRMYFSLQSEMSRAILFEKFSPEKIHGYIYEFEVSEDLELLGINEDENFDESEFVRVYNDEFEGRINLMEILIPNSRNMKELYESVLDEEFNETNRKQFFSKLKRIRCNGGDMFAGIEIVLKDYRNFLYYLGKRKINIMKHLNSYFDSPETPFFDVQEE